MRSLAALAAATVACAAFPAAAAVAAGPPKNFFDNEPKLSQPVFSEIEKTSLRLKAFDGAELYIEVTKPKAPGRYPVILEASPYHGTIADRDGTRILTHPKVDGKSIGLTGYFAPRGYAVVMMDLRGTGRSGGCLDHLGPKDARDLKRTVEWAASQDWSNGRVGMTGHSYVGSTPALAASQDPKGLVTIVPSAGLASMYDHQFQGGVPYNLQWAGPQWAYPYLATMRHMPKIGKEPVQGSDTGDDFGNNTGSTGCQAFNSAFTSGEDQLSGRYVKWHEDRDASAGAAGFNGPIFLIHGVNDNAARIAAADWFLDRGRADDKAWIGQWDHGSNVAPTRRVMQATKAIHSWFDKHLAGRDVDTGPQLEAFLSDSTFAEARGGARTEVLTADRWPADTSRLTLATGNAGTLGTTPGTAGSRTFQGDPRMQLNNNGGKGAGGVDFVSEPLEEDLTLAGLPKLRLSASSATPRTHLIATLYEEYGDNKDEVAEGTRRRISQCSINPELREGVATRSVVVPAQRYDMDVPCFAMAHQVSEGSRLVLRVTTADPDKVALFSANPQVAVFGGPGATAIDLPVVDGADVFADDIPLGTEDGQLVG
jgi:uncharacterized protein